MAAKAAFLLGICDRACAEFARCSDVRGSVIFLKFSAVLLCPHCANFCTSSVGCTSISSTLHGERRESSKTLHCCTIGCNSHGRRRDRRYKSEPPQKSIADRQIERRARDRRRRRAKAHPGARR